MYLKIINQSREVIDALIEEDIVFVRWQERNNLLLYCSKDEAEGFLSYDRENIYHSNAFKDFSESINFEYIDVEIKEISGDEYAIIRQALDESKPIDPEPIPEPEPEPVEPDEDEIIDNNTLELVRTAKISEMSRICNETIVNGTDIILSDNESHHFEFTTEEQLNLITLKEMIAQGETNIPYHAKDELCKFYSVEDMTLIINTATQFKTYHTSYFNSLKNYINSMDSINSISEIEYGSEIPLEHQSDVLKELINNENS